jgi:hypothetical protein
MVRTRVRGVVSFCPSLALMLLLAPAANAAPSVRYSWDACEPLVLNREFAAAEPYAQVLSVTGLAEPLTSFEVSIAIAGTWSAWQFHDFGCQGSARLSASASAARCDPIPGLILAVDMYPGVTDHRLHLVAAGSAPPGTAPDPSARYRLVGFAFDHSFTTGDPFDPPGQCGDGDEPTCFGIEYLSLNGSTGGYTLENSVLTWNLAATPGQCPFPVPARVSTWARVKAMYR